MRRVLFWCFVASLACVMPFSKAFAEGEAVNGYPNWAERVLLEWMNRARVAPQTDLANCPAGNCAEAQCYASAVPVRHLDYSLEHSSRFHSDHMRLNSYFDHPSHCTLVNNIASLYPGTCSGSATCSCTQGALTSDSTVWTDPWSRIGLFGASTASGGGEIIAAGYANPDATFYAWLYEPTSSSTCGFTEQNGHRFLLLSDGYGPAAGAGYSNSYATMDFAGSASDTYKIPSGSHYPQQAAAVDAWVNWSDSAGPSEAKVNVDGTCTNMSLARGSVTSGAWHATLNGFGSGCHRYQFAFKDSGGNTVLYPGTGSLAIGDGSASCPDWAAATPPACSAVAPSTGPVNYALAANGGVASASSTIGSGYNPSTIIDGDRTGLNWGNGGGWADNTPNTWPDWVQINFAGAKNINTVVLYGLQDDYAHAVDPDNSMTFTQYGMTAFDVQVLRGNNWVTVASVTGNNLVKRTVTFPATTTAAIRILLNSAAAGRPYSKVVEVEAWGAPELNNVVASLNGAVASASSTNGPGFAPSSVNDGDRTGRNWGNNGGWADSTPNALPDWVQFNLATPQTIYAATVYGLQDDFAHGVEPSESMTFTQYGTPAFDVQAYVGGTWVTVASVTGNSLIKRNVTFAPVTTNALRVQCTALVPGHAFSHLVEVEAWGTPATLNVALASNGGTASASSTNGSAFAPSTINDGDRTGRNWGNGGGWADATPNVWPDWVQVSFNAAKTINTVSVYTLQDDYANGVEPNDSMIFTQYGHPAFDVQVLSGSSWVTVASITGNNLVKRNIAFPAVTTTGVRVVLNSVIPGHAYSHIVEVEAWQVN